jgi:outer membrane protein assembly factor BamB
LLSIILLRCGEHHTFFLSFSLHDVQSVLGANGGDIPNRFEQPEASTAGRNCKISFRHSISSFCTMNKALLIRLVSILLVVCLVSGCGFRVNEDWSQFHADLPNSGSVLKPSAYAIQPKWTVEVGSVSYSSPVIGSNGRIYVGNADGELVAVNPTGKIRWKGQFPDTIVASPAVADNGDIYFVSIQKVAQKQFKSTLQSLDSNGNLRWSFVFPGNRVVTSSPKILGSARNSNVFIYAGSELFVFNNVGTVVQQKDLIPYGSNTVCGSEPDLGDILPFLVNLFEQAFSCIKFDLTPCEFDPSGLPLRPFYELFGWLDPTVAVLKLPDLDQPIVVVADRFSIIAFRWNESESTLSDLWSKEHGKDCSSDDYKELSSPVFAGSSVVVGRRDGLVLAYDVLTGESLWTYKAHDAVMATPATFLNLIYIVTVSRTDNPFSRLLLLRDNGSEGQLIQEYKLDGESVASPALSSGLVYVITSEGLYSFSANIESLFKNGRIKGGLSSPAVADDGTVYVVNTDKKLWAFPGA